MKNQNENDIVVFRWVYDAIKPSGSAQEVPINKDMMLFAHMAHSIYMDYLNNKKSQDKNKT